ncbi:hypothetical protein [Streptomyces sp. NPDC051219]|uniref:hypothetical protein n=1 Tax=Streptomyces sp. NPDC051219 TaxID=3155283 RepID=UPI00342667FB
MTGEPTAEQRRVLSRAGADSGLLDGPGPVLAALVARGLAVRHPRPPHRHFLTPAGRRLREQLVALAAHSPAPQTAATSGAFAARTDTESVESQDPARLREVRSAWAGLLEMRRLTNPARAVDRPCDWERGHLVQAAALALEAGVGTGYRVGSTAQPEAVRVDGPRLAEFAAALEAAGWQASVHLDRRSGIRYVLASPRRK